MAIGILSGCAAPVKVGNPVDPSEYPRCAASGRGAFKGMTYAKSESGETVSGGGRRVHLDPFTTYSQAVFQAIIDRQGKEGAFRAEDEAATVSFDPAMLKCRITTTADAQGNFSFSGLPYGNYLASSYISWKGPDGKWVGRWNIGYAGVRGGRQRRPLELSGVPEEPIPKAPTPRGP